MERIAAIVVTYNRKDLLLQCVERLLNQQGVVCDVLVVDNASTDGTQQAIEPIKNQRFFYRCTGENLGGAGGFNFGMRWAVEAGYDYVWIMDDDTLPSSDALAQLWAAHQRLKGEYGFLSSVVLWKDGKECQMNRQKIKKSFYEHVELLRHGIIQIEHATFVSLFFPVAVIEKAGLPIKDFFIWGDDIEYTRRISVRIKLPCYLVGQSVVTHMMKNNTGASLADDVPERIDRYRYAFRNENYTYRKEGVEGICYYLARCAREFIRVLLRAKNYRWKRVRVLWSSVCKGFFFCPAVEQVKRPHSDTEKQENYKG